MIIAQTSVTSLPASSGQSTANSNGSLFWWFISLAAIILVGFLILRRTKNRPKLDTSTKSLPKSQSSSRKTVSIDNNRDFAPRKDKASKKKKKKNRDQSEGPSKIVVQGEIKSKKKRSADLATVTVVSSPTTELTPRAPIQVDPIFEPLREVGSLRRSVSYNSANTAKSDSTKSNTDSETKSVADVTAMRQPRAKFERTVNSKATLQSTANRWPAPEANQFSVKPSLAAAYQPDHDSPSTAVTNSTASHQPATVAPPQGLKNFVKKVRLNAAVESESASDVKN